MYINEYILYVYLYTMQDCRYIHTFMYTYMCNYIFHCHNSGSIRPVLFQSVFHSPSFWKFYHLSLWDPGSARRTRKASHVKISPRKEAGEPTMLQERGLRLAAVSVMVQGSRYILAWCLWGGVLHVNIYIYTDVYLFIYLHFHMRVSIVTLMRNCRQRLVLFCVECSFEQRCRVLLRSLFLDFWPPRVQVS